MPLPTSTNELPPMAGASRPTPADEAELAIEVIPGTDAVGVAVPHHDRTGGRDNVGPWSDDNLNALFLDGLRRLGPRTYLAVDLSVRQGFSASEVGVDLGIREGLAAEAIAETKERVEHALATYVLVRSRVGVCFGLRRLVGRHAEVAPTTDLAEVVNTHLDNCAGCAEVWRRIPSPLEALRQNSAPTPVRRLRRRILERWSRFGFRIPGRKLQAIAAVVAAALVLGAGPVSNNFDPARPSVAVQEPASDTESAIRTPSVSLSARPDSKMETALVPSATMATTPEPTLPPTTALTSSEPPMVMIITPVNGQRFDSSFGFDRIDLVAVVQDDVDEGLVIEWTAGSTYLGSGSAIEVTPASECSGSTTYTVTATVTDSSGNTAGDTVTFVIRCSSAEK